MSFAVRQLGIKHDAGNTSVGLNTVKDRVQTGNFLIGKYVLILFSFIRYLYVYVS